MTPAKCEADLAPDVEEESAEVRVPALRGEEVGVARADGGEGEARGREGRIEPRRGEGEEREERGVRRRKEGGVERGLPGGREEVGRARGGGHCGR